MQPIQITSFTHQALTCYNSKGLIYILVSPSQKAYIGLTTNFYSRMNRYKNLHTEGQPAISNAIAKYGFENFKVYILEEIHKNNLSNCEIEWIKIYKLLGVELYNISPGGEHFGIGRVMTQEHKDAIGNANRGRFLTQEHKEKLSLAHLGKTISEETRAKMSATRKGRPAHNKGKKKTNN